MLKPITTIPYALWILLCSQWIFTGLKAQFFYKDLYTLDQHRVKMQLFRQQQVHRVKITSTDPNGQPIPGFSSEQEINKTFTVIATITRTDLSGTNYHTTYFDREGLQIRSEDSLGELMTKTDYLYSLGRLTQIHSTSFASGKAVATEQHQWFYDEKGTPQKMLLIKNQSDTSTVEFVPDANGKILEEKIMNGPKLSQEYYYYDEKGRLTDIVRFNTMALRLLPDYIFEYDEFSRVGSMLMVPEDARNYQQWYYSYDEDGLKILDACYSKEKQLIAKLEYTYTYY